MDENVSVPDLSSLNSVKRTRPITLNRITRDNGREKNLKPSLRQIKTLQLFAQGMPITRAMKEAGYKKSTATKQAARFFRRKSIKTTFEALLEKLGVYGLNDEKYVSKIAEFVDASKINRSGGIVPDYNTQIKGVQIWGKIKERSFNRNENPVYKNKRVLTVEEFITERKDDSDNPQ